MGGLAMESLGTGARGGEGAGGFLAATYAG